MNNNITIVGAGLSGMITALSFAHYGMAVTILENSDTQNESFYSDLRTTALNAASRKFLTKIGVWPDLESQAGPINDIYVVDNKSDDMLHFASHQNRHYEIMGHLIENKLFKKTLYDLVSNHKLINLIDKVDYKIESLGDKVKIIINDKTEKISDLLVICNNHKSEVVQKYFSAKIDKLYGQSALTFTITHSKKHDGCAMEHFLPTGPFATLPLKDQHKSSIVWSIGHAEAELLKNMSEEELLYNVRQNLGEFLGEITINSSIAKFPLKAYISNSYYNDRMVLVADSAHIIHPLAGQGLNQGIKDIESLLHQIISYGICENALRQYQNNRQSDNMAMYQITDNLNKLFSTRSKVLFSLRQIAFKTIDKISPLKALFVSYAMGDR